MGHGFPVSAAEGGRVGFGISNVDLPAARLIADFWGIEAGTRPVEPDVKMRSPLTMLPLG
jgi:hypothetical protein